MKYLNSEPMVFGGTGFGEKVRMVCSNRECTSTSFSMRLGRGIMPGNPMEWRCNKCDSRVEEDKDE